MKIDENQVISLENIDNLSKAIAVGCIKSYIIYYYNNEVYDLYKSLVRDLENEHNPEYVFTKGFDLVSEAKLMLFENLGKRLSDEIQLKHYTKTKTFTVLKGCYACIRRLIGKEVHYDKHRLGLTDEQLIPYGLVSNPIEELDEQEENNDWTNVNKIIEQLNLTDIEKETLECFMLGCSYSEATAMLDRSIATIFERRAKIRKKYMNVFGKSY